MLACDGAVPLLAADARVWQGSVDATGEPVRQLQLTKEDVHVCNMGKK